MVYKSWVLVKCKIFSGIFAQTFHKFEMTFNYSVSHFEKCKTTFNSDIIFCGNDKGDNGSTSDLDLTVFSLIQIESKKSSLIRKCGSESEFADYFQTHCWCLSKYLSKFTKCNCILVDPDQIWISKLKRLQSRSLLVGSGSVPNLLSK